VDGVGGLPLKRLGVAAAVLVVSIAAGSALAAPVHLVVRPATVAPGGVIVVSASSSPCLPRDQVTLISKAFPGHAFGGEGAVNGKVGSHGSFSVRARVRSALPAGRYRIGARCGGGNLGVSAYVRIR
jgi:hypothetical protein